MPEVAEKAGILSAFMPPEMIGIVGFMPRRTRATKPGMPGSVVFADRRLVDMVEKRPDTLDGVAGTRSVGSQKLKLDGEPFLAALMEHG